jgi:hypothetical protein
MHLWRSSDSDCCGTRCTWRVEHPGACRGTARCTDYGTTRSRDARGRCAARAENRGGR